MLQYPISPRAPGLTKKELATVLVNACDNARKGTHGKTLAEAWLKSRHGCDLAWWVFHYVYGGNREDLIPIFDEFGKWSFSRAGFTFNGGAKTDRRFANFVRSKFHWDGSRK